MSDFPPIQGSDAILSVFRDDWQPFVCSTDVSIQIQATKAGTRTKGDGHWKKYTYQDLSFSITLSGLLKFDDTNMTGWDWIFNQTGFTTLLVRVSFDDESGNVRTVQGYVMVETSTISFSPGALVKNDFQLQGSGKLDVFDGLIPCPTAINTITVTGQTGSSGTVAVTYTYTGDVAQVKYRIDGVGDYAYAIAGSAINISGLSVMAHTIEIIPICPNDYEGTGLTQGFVVTKANTCGGTIAGSVIHTSDSSKYSGMTGGLTVVADATSDYILPTVTGTYDGYIYTIDGGTGYFLPAGSQIPISTLPVGFHRFNIFPICFIDGSQYVAGALYSANFTLNSQSSQSVVSYSYTNFPPNNSLSIYVNGVLVINLNVANASGSITVANGATVKSVLQSTQPSHARSLNLKTTDTTTSAILDNQSGPSPLTLQYSFTANGDSFSINAVVSP